MNFLKEIFSKRNLVLLKEMVKTDFKLRYKGSVLGVAWSVIKPLALFVVMYMVFVRFLKMSDGTPTYPIVLLLGIGTWGFFTEATSSGLQSIVARGDLLRKIKFPKIIIVISTIISALISFFINFGIVVIALIFYVIAGNAHLSFDLLWLPINIIELIMLALGFALLLGALYVKFRDISHIWDIVLQILFYAMPIIYPLSFVMKYSPFAAKMILMNPIAQTIQDLRHNLISPTVSTVWNTLHFWPFQIIPILISVGILVLGIFVFNKQSQKFAEEI